jgi:uncharacterized protein (TIGR03663 family)
MSDTKTCNKCGSKNPSNNNFCEQCGTKLTAGGTIPSIPEKNQKPNPSTKNNKNIPAETELKEKNVVISTAPSSGFSISWIQVAYAILLLITVFTRFDHLGFKPHHHDESMHAFYSWQLYKDGDYEYNPMMHGPFQFHGNAFMYYLFGCSDATSRYLAATFGLITVILAIFLTPFIGRTGAFLATAMIVFSPSFMYFDRFTREDAYICGATFAMVVFLFRYHRFRKPTDLWIASLGFIIAFCTKESMFLTIAVVGTYLFMRLLPWADVLIAGGLTATGVLSQLIIPKSSPAHLPALLLLAGCAFLYTMYQLYGRWRFNQKSGPENKLWEIVAGLGIERVQVDILLFIGWWALCLIALRMPFLHLSEPTFFSVILLIAYFAIVARFCWLWLKNVSPALTGSITIMSVIFTLLFTTFFTVGATQPDFLSRVHKLINALYNGAFGGLEYWWGQHDVHRGDQPWYYYLLQLPANELVSFLFSIVAMIYYSIFKNKNMPIFLAYWYIGSMVLFSWAGEKMPWLILHPLLPALLLTAFFVGEIWDSKPAEQVWKSARVAALVIFGLLMTYSLHSAVLLSFYHESNPVEPLVYVQSGPDCKEVDRIVRQISYGETGGPDMTAPDGTTDAEKAMHDGMALTIEDKCSWPFAWMLRDFTRRNHPASITAADNPIIMTATESDAQAYPILSKAGYINRKYKLRIWWVPSWFKKGFPSSDMNSGLFFDWLFSNFIPLKTARPDMVDWNDLKNWVLYRRVWSDLGSYNMRLWVRSDLAQKYGYTEFARGDVPADYPKPDVTPVPTPIAMPIKRQKSK